MTIAWRRPRGVALRLILIRHGEPAGSAKGRCYGKLDVGLSERGRAQMERLAEVLPTGELDAVYTSPRRRASESAAILMRSKDAPTVEPRLGEIDFGKLEGLTYDEAAVRYPDVYEQWMRAPTEVVFPGGESFSAMRERVVEAVSAIREVHSEQTVAIVSHGGVNRIVLADALGMEPSRIFHMDQSHAGVSILDDVEGYPVVRVMNATC